MKILGLVNESNGYYNFKPLYKLQHDELIELTTFSVESIIPRSEKLNINLWFGLQDRSRIENFFFDDSLMVIDFEREELEENRNSFGELNQTAYKLNAPKLIDQDRIQYMEDYGIYYVIPSENVTSKIKGAEVIELNDDYIVEGQDVVIYVENGLFAGPFEVKKRAYDQAFILTTQLKESKYTLFGFSSDNIKDLRLKSSLYDTSKRIRVIKVIDEDEKVGFDVIDDKKLMELFIETVNDSSIVDGKIDISDIDGLLKKYQESQLSGTFIPENIRERRLRRINEIISSGLEVDDAMKSMAEMTSDKYIALLEKYKDTDEVKDLIGKIAEISPELLENMQNSQAAQKVISELDNKKAALEASIQSLEEQKKALDETLQKGTQTETQSDEKNERLTDENKELKDLLEKAKDFEDLKEKKAALEEDINHLEWHEEQLKSGNKELELTFAGKLEEINQKMYDTAIDGFMATKIAESSAEWAQQRDETIYQNIIDGLSGIPAEDLSTNELVDYLCNVIQKVRPTYDRNTVINLAICFSQGFLTVLSGKPGCGKTSICNIFAEALGLKKVGTILGNISGIEPSRYVQVSVERGWTSKRDLIGYYNPLTKAFDKNNKQIYDALQILSIEKEIHAFDLPLFVLLDEANLSPMEYYWADFMNICDGISEYSSINLGGNNVLGVPETLRFMATINNDHTTQELSPRLVDRAWIVTLPKSSHYFLGEETIPDENIKIISWNSMNNAFNSAPIASIEKSGIRGRYENFAKIYESNNINISPRTFNSIMKYCASGIALFEMDTMGRNPETIALDYAISQKLLPKISGFGDDYLEWLNSLLEICVEESFGQSEKIVKDIIIRGNAEMKSYQFFN